MSNSAKNTRKTSEPDPHTEHPLNVVEQVIFEIKAREVDLIMAKHNKKMRPAQRRLAAHILDLLKVAKLEEEIQALREASKRLS